MADVHVQQKKLPSEDGTMMLANGQGTKLSPVTVTVGITQAVWGVARVERLNTEEAEPTQDYQKKAPFYTQNLLVNLH